MGAMGTSLEHIMVVGGTPKEWDSLTEPEWLTYATRLGEAAAAAGSRWLTIRPYGPEPGDDASPRRRRHWHVDAVTPGGGSVGPDGRCCTVIVDSSADGRAAFAAAAAAVPADQPIDERTIAAALYEPATAEPDLIVIVGPHDRLPPSLAWELAYGELVYIDVPSFSDVAAADLGAAIETYQHRHRRFGGI